MNKRFDLRKLTLTDFKPSEYLRATNKLEEEQNQSQQQSLTPTSEPVPHGRTTLKLNKVRGIVSSQSSPTAVNPQPQEQPQQIIQQSSQTGNQTENISIESSSLNIEQSTHISLPAAVEPQVKSLPPVDIITTSAISTSVPAEEFQPQQEQLQVQKCVATDSGTKDIDSNNQASYPTERVAALKTLAVKENRTPKSHVTPETLVPFNSRQPKWLKEKFFQACSDNGATPSLVIRNFMKNYCGLCLLLALITSATAGEISHQTFSADQLLSYFYVKSFNLATAVPPIKTSLAIRHSLWQTGEQDSAEYVYHDLSNTRLEARLDIPILDLAYLRDRSKDKDELRAFVMKSLSKILAAQKSVSILSSRAFALSARIDYLKNQVNLKLVNKSELFPVEDQLYSVQSQLYDAQSTLEQRIIDLAVIAGNDWQYAYTMVIKWDGKLFQ
jgi:hypothetical protein